MSIGERIKELRIQRGFTQGDLSERIGVNRATLSGYERNTIIPPSNTLLDLAKELRTSADYLLGSTDNPLPASKSEVPIWATAKDKRDFKKMLEEEPEVLFDGVPLDEEDREKLKRVMEAIFWDAKKQNKRKQLDDDN
ncbi:helix-turn-helix domain-containing protein [Paenibacillus thiaminolyticus]|uniref:helix-turn-helix domain-containing protein n=1 Tax=Paenibacillus thiaminolyticus TaxID=49283 RepID=UPI003D2C19D2